MSILNPWRGLSSYEDPAVSKQEYLFCGRDRESEELFREIDHNPVVTLYGRSGLGKTSLLNAGVFPLLRTYGYRPVPVRFGTDTGQQDLAVAMLATISDHCAAHCRLSEEEWARLAAEDPVALLWHYFHTTMFTDRETAEEVYPVLVLDQFEETIMSNREAAILLLRQMQALLGRSRRFPSETYSAVQNFRFVIALREDYLYCLEDCITAGSCWDLRNCRYRLLPIRYSEARAIVLKPGGDVLDPTDSERIADTILEKSLINPGTHRSSNPDDAEVNPQMVSLLCTQLFDKAYPDGDALSPHRITAALLDKEKDTTLKDFYLSTIRKTGLDAQQQHQLEERLVSEGRRQSAGYNLLASLITREKLDVLVREGLLRTYTTATNREPQVEIIHDQIATAVESVKQEWLVEEQKRKIAEQEAERERQQRQIEELERLKTKMLTNQSRYVTEKASQLVDEGDSYRARRLLLHVLKNCPYTVEAESALMKAMNHETAILRGHTGSVKAVAFSPDGSRISGSDDMTLILWDVESGKPIGEPMRGHTGDVNSVAFSPDGSRIASGASDSTLILWDTKSGKPIGDPMRGHSKAVLFVAFSPDGSRIVSGSYDNTIILWDAKSVKPIGEPMRMHTDRVTSVAFSPGGSRIISGSWNGHLILWDTKSGKPIGEPMRGHSKTVNSVAFSPDGRLIVSGADDNTLILWDAESGKPICDPMRGHTAPVTSVEFSPDGSRIVSGSWDNTLILWDAKSGKPIGEPMRGHTGSVKAVAFSPDGSRIVSGSYKTLILWDAKSCKSIGKPIMGHTDRVFSVSVAFSPDGDRIVSGSLDHTLILWDAKSGKPIGEPMRGHTDMVTTVAFGPDGSRIVSGSVDKTIILWDVKSGKLLETLKGHTDSVFSVAFSPDGSQIVSGSADKTLILWDVPTLEQMMKETEERFGDYPLTDEEKRKYYIE